MSKKASAATKEPKRLREVVESDSMDTSESNDRGGSKRKAQKDQKAKEKFDKLARSKSVREREESGNEESEAEDKMQDGDENVSDVESIKETTDAEGDAKMETSEQGKANEEDSKKRKADDEKPAVDAADAVTVVANGDSKTTTAAIHAKNLNPEAKKFRTGPQVLSKAKCGQIVRNPGPVNFFLNVTATSTHKKPTVNGNEMHNMPCIFLPPEEGKPTQNKTKTIEWIEDKVNEGDPRTGRYRFMHPSIIGAEYLASEKVPEQEKKNIKAGFRGTPNAEFAKFVSDPANIAYTTLDITGAVVKVFGKFSLPNVRTGYITDPTIEIHEGKARVCAKMFQQQSVETLSFEESVRLMEAFGCDPQFYLDTKTARVIDCNTVTETKVSPEALAENPNAVGSPLFIVYALKPSPRADRGVYVVHCTGFDSTIARTFRVHHPAQWAVVDRILRACRFALFMGPAYNGKKKKDAANKDSAAKEAKNAETKDAMDADEPAKLDWKHLESYLPADVDKACLEPGLVSATIKEIKVDWEDYLATAFEATADFVDALCGGKASRDKQYTLPAEDMPYFPPLDALEISDRKGMYCALPPAPPIVSDAKFNNTETVTQLKSHESVGSFVAKDGKEYSVYTIANTSHYVKRTVRPGERYFVHTNGGGTYSVPYPDLIKKLKEFVPEDDGGDDPNANPSWRVQDLGNGQEGALLDAEALFMAVKQKIVDEEWVEGDEFKKIYSRLLPYMSPVEKNKAAIVIYVVAPK